MRIFTTILVTLSFFITSLSHACLNEYYVTLTGKVEEGYGNGSVPSGHEISSPQELCQKLDYADNMWRTTHDIKWRSNYGVLLVHLRRYAEAEKNFTDIEHSTPGLYGIAANLGTLYELAGDNEKALMWIKRAVQIDPTSHQNSEWLHVNILEAKIKGEDFYTSEFLIGTTFGTDVIPSSDKSEVELSDLQSALYYQLNERMTFIKPGDKIIGLLAFELGNSYALTTDVTSSLRVYDKSIQYGYFPKTLIRRYSKFLLMQAWAENEYDYAMAAMKLIFFYFIPCCILYAIARAILRVFWGR